MPLNAYWCTGPSGTPEAALSSRPEQSASALFTVVAPPPLAQASNAAAQRPRTPFRRLNLSSAMGALLDVSQRIHLTPAPPPPQSAAAPRSGWIAADSSRRLPAE